MKIIIEFEDRHAVIVILILTVLGWIVSYSIIYTTYYLSTGQDPLKWMEENTWIPDWLIEGLRFIGINAGYFGVIGGMILATMVAVLVYKGRRGR